MPSSSASMSVAASGQGVPVPSSSSASSAAPPAQLRRELLTVQRSQHEAGLKAVRDSGMEDVHLKNTVSYLEGLIRKVDRELAATAPTGEQAAAAHTASQKCKDRYDRMQAQLRTRIEHYKKAEKKLAARNTALDAEADRVRKVRK